MISDKQLEELGRLVATDVQSGASRADRAQVELQWAILGELRALRKTNEQIARQLDSVSAGGTSLLVEARP